jgi:hypothetical protein
MSSCINQGLITHQSKTLTDISCCPRTRTDISYSHRTSLLVSAFAQAQSKARPKSAAAPRTLGTISRNSWSGHTRTSDGYQRNVARGHELISAGATHRARCKSTYTHCHMLPQRQYLWDIPRIATVVQVIVIWETEWSFLRRETVGVYEAAAVIHNRKSVLTHQGKKIKFNQNMY